MTALRLAAITVNYGTAEMTLQAVRTLLQELGDTPSRVYIVDNCSPDNSVEVLRKGLEDPVFKERAELLAAPRNGGFGYGNNLAIVDALQRDPKPDYVYLLNPDAFVRKGAIDALLRFMDGNPKAGICGSFLETEDGELWSPGFRYPNIVDELEQGLRLGVVSRLLESHLQRMPMPKEPQEVDWVGGPSFMIRREVLERVGRFDETFFLYFEETDLCFRARKAGYPSFIVPESVVMHIGQVSTKLDARERRRPRYWFDSRRLFFEKSRGKAYRCAADLSWLAGLLTFRLRYALQRRENPDPPRLIRDFVRYNLGLL